MELASMDHIMFWRKKFGFDSELAKLYSEANFSQAYKNFLDSLSITDPNDKILVEYIKKLQQHDIYMYCCELGFGKDVSFYSYSYAGFFIPHSLVSRAQTLAFEDETMVVYLTDPIWEQEQRKAEHYKDPHTIARELKQVTCDESQRYYNFIWKHYPFELFPSEKFETYGFAKTHVSMQIRHNKHGNHLNCVLLMMMQLVATLNAN